MTSGGFGAQSPALGTAASAFESQSDPIIQQSARLESIKGSASTTGRDYAALGDAYRQAITQSLEKVIRSFGEKCIWVSTNLTDTQRSYDNTDAGNAAGLKSSGSGVG